MLGANAGITGNVVLGIQARERLAAIGRADPEAVVPLVLEALKPPRATSNDARQRYLAFLGVLGDIGPAAAAAVPILRGIVSEADARNEWLRFGANLALTNIGTPEAAKVRDDASRRDLAAIAQKSDAGTRMRSVHEQAYLLRRELRSGRPEGAIIDASVMALGVLGPGARAATPTLLRAFADPRLGSGVRQRTGNLLERLGVADPAAAGAALAAPDPVADVIADTRSPYPLVSALAMQELGRYGPRDAVIDALLDALVAGRSAGDAARELGTFGPAAARVVPALVARLDQDDSASVVIQALARLRVADDTVVTPLRRLVAEPGGRHRAEAALALGELKAPAAAPELMAALTDSRGYVRSAAATALGQLVPSAVAAIPPLTRLLSDGDAEVRLHALSALGRFGPAAQRAVPDIRRHLDADERRVAAAATEALERIGGREAGAAIAADAARFAAVDRADYQRGRAAGPSAVQGLLRELPDARRLALAEAAALDADVRISGLGLDVLLATGRGDRAVPALARLIVGREDGEELFVRLKGGAIDATLFTAVAARLRSDYPGLPAAQQDRVRRAFAAAGLAPP